MADVLETVSPEHGAEKWIRIVRNESQHPFQQDQRRAIVNDYTIAFDEVRVEDEDMYCFVRMKPGTCELQGECLNLTVHPRQQKHSTMLTSAPMLTNKQPSVVAKNDSSLTISRKSSHKPTSKTPPPPATDQTPTRVSQTRQWSPTTPPSEHPVAPSNPSPTVTPIPIPPMSSGSSWHRPSSKYSLFFTLLLFAISCAVSLWHS